MLAAQYVGRQTIEVVEVPPRQPGPGEVQLAVAYTGICGTDLHILHGAMDARVQLPAVLGHEMSGRIVAVGPEVTDWSVDDPVTVMPLRWCGACAACRAGHHHICENLDFVGIDSAGALQQLWTVPQDVLVRLPPGLGLRNAVVVEPVAVAIHDVRRAALERGERAVVVGGGPIGLLVASVSAAAGAEVLVLEVSHFRRSLLAGLGFATLDPAAGDTASRVAEWAGPDGVNVSFEVSGSQPGLDSAVDVLGVRGRLVVVGIHPQPRLVNLQRVFWKELSIVGARVYDRSDFDTAVALVAEGGVPVDALISRVEPLASASEAFGALASGAEIMKVVVDCGGELSA
jgi:(R,R)-butanediol dehydrogenase / meso-butanediol dehydrogenase / diacetyl reductase